MKKIGKRIIACLMIMMFLAPSVTGIIHAEAVDDVSPYFYFDNSLSGYDKLEYSVDGGAYQNMVRLADLPNGDPRCPADETDVNPAYTYVTTEKVDSAVSIRFRGTDSGTVYDTASNYQISRVSREWGYDYQDFVWESDPLAINSSWNCYYGAALAMQYKYNGEKDGTYTDFIKTVGWADKKPEEADVHLAMDLSGLSDHMEKGVLFEDVVLTDEVGTKATFPAGTVFDGSLVTGTFTVSVPAQTRMISDVTVTVDGVSYDQKNGWFFLDEPSEYSVTANGMSELSFDYKGAWSEPELERILNLRPKNVTELADGEHDTSHSPYELVGPLTVENDSSTKRTEDHSKSFSSHIRINGAGSGSKQSVIIHADMPGEVIVYALSGSTDTRYVGLYQYPDTTDDSGTVHKTEVQREALNGSNSEIKIVTLKFDAPGDYYVTSTGSRISLYGLDLYYRTSMDRTFAFEPFDDIYPVYPEDGMNRTFSGYHFAMDGMTGLVNDKNRIGEQSQIAGAEGSVATASVSDGSESNYGIDPKANLFLNAEVTLYDYFSDWELTGRTLFDHGYVVGSGDGSDYRTAYAYDDYTGRETDYGADVSPSVPVTYSESASSISYTYQGDTLNHGILDYYGKDSISPLYFGSNSWFTGNGRYDLQDHYNTRWDASVYNNGYISGSPVMEVTTSERDAHNVYRIPDGALYGNPVDRSYLGQFGKVDNASLGMSNSRSLAGLVSESETKGNVTLSGSEKQVPYFNKAFLEGDNEKNIVYGKVYENVTFPVIQNTSDEYYTFDSTSADYAVRLTKDSSGGYFMNYTQDKVVKADADPDGTGQFYPFNSSKADTHFSSENLMFGMKMSIPLTTYSDAGRRSSILKFSGDDDVWIYLRGEGSDGTSSSVLAMDIGGTHAASGGVIDTHAGYAVTESTYDASDPSLGLQKDGVGNSLTETTSDLESAAFVIATSDGITEVTDMPLGTPSFFGDVYGGSGTYSASIVNEASGKPAYYDVTLSGQVTKNGTVIQTEGETSVVRLALAQLSDVMDRSGDTLDYYVDIFYLERGLNGSNFKLAFKNVTHTLRSVDKTWTDLLKGFNQHDGMANGVIEDVKTDLWREYATPDMERPVTLRSVAYDDGDVRTNSAFADEGTRVVTYDYFSRDFQIAINGVLLTKQVYEQLNADGLLDLQIQSRFNGESIIPDEDGYFHPPAYHDYVEVRFNAISSTRRFPDAEYVSWDEETYLVENANAWLIEFYNTGALGNSKLEWWADTGDKEAVYENTYSKGFPESAMSAKDMRLILIENLSDAQKDADGTFQQTEHRLTTIAVPVNKQSDITTEVSDMDNLRRVYYKRTVWNGIYDTSDYRLDETSRDDYKEDGTYGLGSRFTKTVKSDTDTDNYFVSIVTDNGKDGKEAFAAPGNNKKLLPVSFTGRYEIPGSAFELIESDISLSSPDWARTWEDLADSVSVNGISYSYRYYITPERVNDRIDSFTAKYENAGRSVDPVWRRMRVASGTEPDGTVIYDEKEMQLYLCDKNISIVNTPSASLQIDKTWLIPPDAPDEKQPEEITIDIYRGVMKDPGSPISDIQHFKTIQFEPDLTDDKYTGTYSMSVDGRRTDVLVDGIGWVSSLADVKSTDPVSGMDSIGWSYTLKGVPLYADDGSRYVYYAAEQPLADVDVRTQYTTGGIKTAYGTIYPFSGSYEPDSFTGTFTMDVTNRLTSSAFDLSVSKSVTAPEPYQDETFTFSLQLTNDVTLLELFSCSVMEGGSEIETKTLALDGDEITFSLKHGQTVVIHEIPEETKWKVTETSGGMFATDITVSEDGTLLRTDDGKTTSGILDAATEVSYVNTLIRGSIRLNKKDGEGNPLSNVAFEITGRNGYTKTVVSDVNGEVVFTDLEPDIYTVIEKTHLDGYIPLMQPLTVELPVKMTKKQAEERNADFSKLVYDEGEDIYYAYDVTYDVTNNKSFEIPATGRKYSGFVFLTVGIMALSFAVCIYMTVRRKHS